MILAVCGSSGAGKTTVSREFLRHGFSVVSASGIAAQMFLKERGFSPTKPELARYGLHILDSSLEKEFAEHIICAVLGKMDVVVDGLRSRLALARLRSEFGAIVVLLTRPASPASTVAEPELPNSVANLYKQVDSKLGMSEEEFDLVIRNDEAPVIAFQRIKSEAEEIATKRRNGMAEPSSKDNLSAR